MKQCKCGNDRFYASQRVYTEVIIDGYGNWQENLKAYDAEEPYGPCTCTRCHMEYNDVCDIPEVAEPEVVKAEAKKQSIKSSMWVRIAKKNTSIRR
jgi:hypothetical protein